MENIDISSALSWALVALLGGTGLMEVSKIKVNPWSWIIKRIGAVANEDLIKQVTAVQAAQADLKKDFEYDKAERWRTEILQFGDELTFLATPHTAEMWKHILDVITKYDAFCKVHPDFPNAQTVETARFIRKRYRVEFLRVPEHEHAN